MTSRKKKPFEDAAQEVTDGLGGLFGALNEALGEMMSRLDDGTSGTVERDHTFQTPKGPVRAQAGVRLRMGGMDVGNAAQTTPEPKPVNRNRPKAPTAPPPPQVRTAHCDVFEDNTDWIVTADLPGVAKKEVQISANGTVLAIKTNGSRHYAAQVDLGAPFDDHAVQITLRNGILTLKIPKGGTA